jgi:hypothetical protein
MKTLRAGQVRNLLIVTWLIAAIGLAGCAPIQLIAPYDQKTDEGVTNLQKATAEFLTRIERQGGSTPEDFRNQTKFYDDVRVMLSVILVRAEALPKNTLTVQQIEILQQQFQKLEQDHKSMGISQAAVPQLERAFNRTFTAILTLELAKKEPKQEDPKK